MKVLGLVAATLAPAIVMAAEPTLPSVRTEVLPPWPADLEDAEPRVVVVDLTVGADGRVLEAAVDDSVVEPFRRLALDAALDTRFEPGTDAAGTPAVMAIRYGVFFDPVVRASVVGRLLVAGVRAPAPGVRMRWYGAGGTERSAVSRADGSFALAGLSAGPWSVVVDDDRFEPGREEVVVLTGDRFVDATLYARSRNRWDEDDADLIVEVVGESDQAEVVERRLQGDDLRYLPGSGGDLLRAVQNLPGVGRAPFGIGQLLIRGTAPEDTRYTVDGMELPLVFHFGGVTSVISTDLVDRVDFLSSSFGVRYGRNLGGRVDVVTTPDLPQRFTGNISLDLFQVGGFVAIPVGDDTAVYLSMRRSYADTVLTPVLSEANQRFRAPRYYDAQLRVLHKLAGGGAFDALVVLSDDRFATFDDEDPDAFSVGYATTFQKARFRWLAPLAHGWRNELSVLAGPDLQSLDVGDSAATEERVSIDVREEIRLEVDEGWGWRMGLDVAAGQYAFDIDVQSFGLPESGRTGFFMPAMYLEPTWNSEHWSATFGLRADLATWDGLATLWSVDPRMTVQWRPADNTSVSLGVGRFSQLPTPRQVLPEADGTPTLNMPWALTSSLGVRQRFGSRFEAELTLWLSRLDDLVVGREGRFRFFTVPPPAGPVDNLPYANEGDGWTYGAELSLRYDAPAGSAWLTATLGRSLRRGRGDAELAMSSFDQPFVINAIGSWKLPRRWRLGARARGSAGLPYTPVANRLFDLDENLVVPLFAEANSARLPSFFSLDLRVDKTWVYRRWEFSMYLDVLNVTNNRNLEVIGWTSDYAQEQGIFGLPIVPVFGFRGDW